MGNEFFSQYSIEKPHYLTGGHLNLWKIYRGIHKNTYQKVSVFVFDKKTLDQFPKNDHEALLSILKNEAASLVKFKHPNILSIVEQLIEDKYSLGFITEDISYSLSKLSQTKQFSPSPLEIKLIMSELSNTILFLNNNCNIVHTNINPDGIFISNDLHVKVSSLNFSLGNENENDQDMTCTNFSKSFLNRNLSFAAPEIVYSAKATANSDIFSLGLLFCFLLKSLKGDNSSLLELSNNIPEDYKRAYSVFDNKINSMDNNTLEQRLITMMLKEKSKQRIAINDLVKHSYFTDNCFQALLFILNTTTNDFTKNLFFYKQYPFIFPLFENKIISNYFLPSLLNNLKNDNLTNILLPNVFVTCEHNSSIDFEETIWPKLKDLFQMKTIPAASLHYLLLKLTYISETISAKEFSTHCISIVSKAMDCGVVKIQIAVADAFLGVSSKIDTHVFNNQLYPRILQILANTTSNGLKVKFLEVLMKVAASLEQGIINASLLQFLDLFCKKNLSYPICVGVLKIYEEIEKCVSIDAITKKIIPNLISILSTGSLSPLLFDNFITLIQKLLRKIKNSREKELVQEPIIIMDNLVKEKYNKDTCSWKNMSYNERISVVDDFFNKQDDIGNEKEKYQCVAHSDKIENKVAKNVDNESVKELKAKSSSIQRKNFLEISNANKHNQKQNNINTPIDLNKINTNEIMNTVLLQKETQENTIQIGKKKSKFDQWDDEDEKNVVSVENSNIQYLPSKEKEKRTKLTNIAGKTFKQKQQSKEQINTAKTQNEFINNLDSLLND